MKIWKERLSNTEGSSMISVLVAFIILLIGIAGFAGAVGTANDMVRRAEVLNAVTGTVMNAYYKESAYRSPGGDETYILPVYGYTEDGSGKETVYSKPSFRIRGRLDMKPYTATATVKKEGETESEQYEYELYFYR